jgi:hypothetical protein
MNEWILKQVALEKDCFYWLVFFFLSFSIGILYLLYRVRLFIFIMRYYFIFFKCGVVIKSLLGRDIDSSFGGCN